MGRKTGATYAACQIVKSLGSQRPLVLGGSWLQAETAKRCVGADRVRIQVAASDELWNECKRADAVIIDDYRDPVFLRKHTPSHRKKKKHHLLIICSHMSPNMSPEIRTFLTHVFCETTYTWSQRGRSDPIWRNRKREPRWKALLAAATSKAYRFLVVEVTDGAESAAQGRKYYYYHAASPAALASMVKPRSVFPPSLMDHQNHWNQSSTTYLWYYLPTVVIFYIAGYCWLPDAIVFYSTCRYAYNKGTVFISRAPIHHEYR